MGISRKHYINILKGDKIILVASPLQRLKLTIALYVGNLILKIDPENIDSICNRGFCLLGLGRTEESILIFEKVVKIAQKNDVTTCVDDALFVLDKLKQN